jgi:hypothetical protein
LGCGEIDCLTLFGTRTRTSIASFALRIRWKDSY